MTIDAHLRFHLKEGPTQLICISDIYCLLLQKFIVYCCKSLPKDEVWENWRDARLFKWCLQSALYPWYIWFGVFYQSERRPDHSNLSETTTKIHTLFKFCNFSNVYIMMVTHLAWLGLTWLGLALYSDKSMSPLFYLKVLQFDNV